MLKLWRRTWDERRNTWSPQTAKHTRTACSALQQNAVRVLDWLIDRWLCLITHLSLRLWKVAMTNNKQWKGDKHELHQLHNSLRTVDNFMPTGAHSYCMKTKVGHSEAQEKQSVYLLQAFQKTSDRNTSFSSLWALGGWGGHTVRQDCSRPKQHQRAAFCNVTWVSCSKLWGFLNPRTRWNDTTAVEQDDGDATGSHLQSLFQRISESMKNEQMDNAVQ